jgi:hypothetical protein
VFPRRGDLPVPEHGRHIREVDPALAELQSHVVLRLIRRTSFGQPAAHKWPQASAAMNAFHAPTMSAFSQNARGSPPLAVAHDPRLALEVHVSGFRAFSSAGRTPVEAMTMNRALVFASVRLAATSRNVFAGTRTFAASDRAPAQVRTACRPATP